MIEFDRLRAALEQNGLARCATPLCSASARQLGERAHGHLLEWMQAVGQLPDVLPTAVDLTGDTLLLGRPGDLHEGQEQRLFELLQRLKPWRKGPFRLFGCHIDSEWRSDLKWQRLAPHIESLDGRRVLDVGCGNGYHCWRMRGAGARLVVGIDPGQLNFAQFSAIKRYLPLEPVFLLPLADHQLPDACRGFDTLFSMGVLQHSRSPARHLALLHRILAPAGELVLECLVMEGADIDVLVPQGRYAKMRNVWMLPTPARVQAWLVEAGFGRVRLVDVTRTTPGEQRRTAWMTFESLADFLDPIDPCRTVEGYPAPTRALFVAEKNQ